MKRLSSPLAVTLLFTSFGISGLSAQPVINEIMQSNINTIMDDLNEYPDSWVEIYNSSSKPINLADYSIGISDDPTEAWSLPDETVAANGYVLIYCDKEGKGKHTDFRLESSKGGSVFLFSSKDGSIVDSVKGLKEMPAPDIAYGRLSGQSDKWGYFLEATPGGKNPTKAASSSIPLPLPNFSLKGRICTAPVEVTLSMPGGCPDGTVIRYSLDSSEVTEKSPLYDGKPIKINKTTVVRARLFHPEFLTNVTSTNSYIFHHTDKKIPIISITTDNPNLTDPAIGLLAGSNFLEDWRRPANIEYFEEDRKQVINQLGEFRIGGHSSRKYKSKSMIVYANKRFGKKNFSHTFFPDQKPELASIKSFVVRNGGGDYYECHMRDAISQHSLAPYLHADWQAYRPVAVYRNGKYVGLLNIRERSNLSYIESTYNGLDDIDMLENWKYILEGDGTAPKQLRALFENENAQASDFLDIMDIEQFIDIQMSYLYLNNCDYPSNNFILWRPKTEGAKWKAFLKDIDYAMGLKNTTFTGDRSPSYPTLDWLYDPTFPGVTWGHNEYYTLPFRRLMSFEEISEPAFDRAFVAFGSYLRAEKIIKLIDEFDHAISGEIDKFVSMYDISRHGTYKENLDYMKDWITEREKFFPAYFSEYYGLGEVGRIRINQNKDFPCVIKINGIELQTESFDGVFPIGRPLNITFESIGADTGYSGWLIQKFENHHPSTCVDSYSYGNFSVTPELSEDVIFSLQPVPNISGVDEIISSDSGNKRYFDLTGRECDADNLVPGIYIEISNGESRKTLIY